MNTTKGTSDRRLEALKAQALDVTPNVILITDAAGTILWANRAASINYGYRLDELVGETPRILSSGQHDPSFYHVLWETILSGVVWRGAIINRTKGGTLLHEEMSITPIVDEEGSIESFIAVKQDITERQRREDALRQRTETHLRAAKEKAVAADAAKSQFIANISHELRTPLNGILGYAQLLTRDERLNPSQHEAADLIKSSGEHLLELINDILDLSKVEADQPVLNPTTFRLDTFLIRVVKAFAPRAQEKAIHLLYDFEGPVEITIETDEKRLRQVLFNLIGNAIKFTDRGEVRLIVRRRGSQTRFEVADTGPGIPTHELEKIFEPFHQAGAPERRVRGTGLGLAISRKLVKLMGSDIHVESAPGIGSRFFFSLLLPPARDLDRGQALAAQGPPGGNDPKPPSTLPIAELETLRTLCRQGDIIALRKHAEALRGRGSGHEAFLDQILDLATQFRMRAIREAIREQLDRRGPREEP